MGLPSAPNSPWGRDEIEIAGDGRVQYANLRGTLRKTVTAQLAPEAVRALFAAIAASPFPAWTQPAFLPPGSTLVELTVDDTTIHIDYHTALKAPGYGAILKLITPWTGVLRAAPDKRAPSADLAQITDVAE